jgi:DNA-directed RNA polymerase subunit M/transcription elongation factor TFIIS
VKIRRGKVISVVIACIILLGLVAPIFQGCGSGDSTTSSGGSSATCTSCGSGDVYWDSNAKRCRDNDNGQFVKSCCCGH